MGAFADLRKELRGLIGPSRVAWVDANRSDDAAEWFCRVAHNGRVYRARGASGEQALRYLVDAVRGSGT